MKFIRTQDADGKPLPVDAGKQIQEEALKSMGLTSSEANGIIKTDPEPMTEQQVAALNELMSRAQEEGYGTIQTLIGMRDVLEKQIVNKGMREKLIKEFVRGAYLDPRQEFSERQAVAALNTLLGISKQEAIALVKYWWANPNE